MDTCSVPSSMKQPSPMLRAFLAFSLALVALSLAGCATTKNPVDGWTPDGDSGYVNIKGSLQAYIKTIPYGKAVQEDVQTFVDQMPVHRYGDMQQGYVRRSESYWIDHVSLFHNEEGQHAVMIEIPLDGTWTNYVLFYDSHGVRIKAVKWISGYYRS
jgi:hypothetical protein